MSNVSDWLARLAELDGSPSVGGLAARQRSKVEHATTADFSQKVLQADKPVLVDFFADWCGPCRAQSPIVEEFARENPEVKVVKVNSSENPELSVRYQVDTIPRLIVFKEGKPVVQHAGIANKAILAEMLKYEPE